MNCREARELLGPYLDSELDTETTARVNIHIERCVACARRFEAETRLERAIVQRLHAGEPGDEARVGAMLARIRRRRPRRVAAGIAVAAAVVVAAALILRDARPSLLEAALDDGAVTRIPGVREPAVVAAVKRRLPGFPYEGYELVECHPCELGGVTVVRMGLLHAEEWLSLFLVDAARADDFREGNALNAGRRVESGSAAARRIGAEVWIAVGPGSRELVERIAKRSR